MDSGISMDTLEDARAFFQKDRFATEAGMTIEEAAPGRAVIRLTLTEAHQNAMGCPMGGVLCTMADFACAVASNFGTGTGLHVSADANVSFLNPCLGQVLTAEAVCIKPGKRLSWYEVTIRDDLEILLIKATFIMCTVDAKPAPQNTIE